MKKFNKIFFKGVTIPSQLRYVYYFEKGLNNGLNEFNYNPPSIFLKSIKLNSIPNFGYFGGCGKIL